MFQPESYHGKEECYYNIKKKVWFGWEHIYSCGIKSRFETKRDAQLYLLTIYGRRREREV